MGEGCQAGSLPVVGQVQQLQRLPEVDGPVVEVGEIVVVQSEKLEVPLA